MLLMLISLIYQIIGKKETVLYTAVEIHLGDNDNNILNTWMFEEDEMKESLQKELPIKLHLQLWDGQKTPQILNGVKESGIMVYEDLND
jgi:uncharacterized protein (UPF0128 family)